MFFHQLGIAPFLQALANRFGDEPGGETDEPEVFSVDIKTGKKDQDGDDAPVNDLEPDIGFVQLLQDVDAVPLMRRGFDEVRRAGRSGA